MTRRALIPVALLAAALASVPATLRGAEPSNPLTVQEFEQLRRDLHVKSRPWGRIPWQVSITEARQLAVRERKPIFLVVNTGNCLGYV